MEDVSNYAEQKVAATMLIFCRSKNNYAAVNIRLVAASILNIRSVSATNAEHMAGASNCANINGIS
jgi:hypothetical protein